MGREEAGDGGREEEARRHGGDLEQKGFSS